MHVPVREIIKGSEGTWLDITNRRGYVFGFTRITPEAKNVAGIFAAWDEQIALIDGSRDMADWTLFSYSSEKFTRYRFKDEQDAVYAALMI